jgi:hypothetical protein
MKCILLKDGKAMFDFPDGQIVWQPWDGFVTTFFFDNTSCPSTWNDTVESWQMARELGYEHPREMSVDHEILHTFLAGHAGLSHSPTLWEVAHQKGEMPLYKQYEEEAEVLGFQRFLNTGVVDNYLAGYQIRTNKSLEELRNEYRRMLQNP